MQINRTFDEEFIFQCYSVPGTWEAISDDEHINKDLFFPNMDRSNYWLEVKDGNEKLGVFLGLRTNHVCYEAHTILLPVARGRAKYAAIAAIDWMFYHTPCKRLITNVPTYNKPAIKLSLDVGMKQFGVNEKSFQKGGKLYDQILLGISKRF